MQIWHRRKGGSASVLTRFRFYERSALLPRPTKDKGGLPTVWRRRRVRRLAFIRRVQGF